MSNPIGYGLQTNPVDGYTSVYSCLSNEDVTGPDNYWPSYGVAQAAANNLNVKFRINQDSESDDEFI